MKTLVAKLTDARKNIIEVIDKLPESKKDEVFVGKWDLKDLIAHLTGWANYQIGVLNAIKSGSEPDEPGKIDDFNQKSTESKKKLSWKSVYNEWIDTSQKLIDEYNNLEKSLWYKPIWKDKPTTLEEFIKIEIRHYQQTHFPQIERLLKV